MLQKGHQLFWDGSWPCLQVFVGDLRVCHIFDDVRKLMMLQKAVIEGDTRKLVLLYGVRLRLSVLVKCRCVYSHVHIYIYIYIYSYSIV